MCTSYHSVTIDNTSLSRGVTEPHCGTVH
jgi:hypothetical protein